MELVAADGQTPLRQAIYEAGSSGFGNQLQDWNPQSRSVDAALLPVLEKANARTDDVIRNSAVASNALQIHQDHIVGSEFRLSYKPNWHLLGIKEDDGFVRDVESIFRDIAEDPACHLDAERKRTFTMMVREGISCHASSGEIMSKPEWIEDIHSPLRTCIRGIAPRRVTNPNRRMDSDTMKAGIETDRYGRAVKYHIEQGGNRFGVGKTWRSVNKVNRSGRTGIIHVFEPKEASLTRGVNTFLSCLQQIKMLDTLQNTTLQRAVMNAMYAASIESELGSDQAMEFLLGAQSGRGNNTPLETLLTSYGDFYSSNNIKFNGVKVPHLFPGDKLNINSPGNADNGFTSLEASIMRGIAQGTSTDYATLSRNYSQMSYSTIRASMNDSWRYFMGRRKIIANRYASIIFALVFEELLMNKEITLPRGARYSFEQRRHAWTKCDWIGAGRLAIDGLKEVKESAMLIELGLSTYEEEAAKLGKDYQELLAQQVKEISLRKEKGLPVPRYALIAGNEAAQAQAQEQ